MSEGAHRRFSGRLLALLSLFVLLPLGTRAQVTGVRADSFNDGNRAARNDPAFYVARAENPVILVLNAQGMQVSKLTTKYKSSAIVTDSQGDLFASGNSMINEVEVYTPPNYFFSFITLPRGEQANGVAVDARSGMVAVFSTHGEFGATRVSFYRHGAATPCRVVKPEHFFLDGAGAFDHAGTLYADISTGSGDYIASISGSCNPGATRILNFKQQFLVTGGFMFNNDDNFVIQGVVSPTDAPIYTFRHPTNGQFGYPIAMTILPPYEGQQQGFATLTGDGKHLIAGGYHNIAEYDYPVAGKPVWNLQGVAGRAAAVHPLVP